MGQEAGVCVCMCVCVCGGGGGGGGKFFQVVFKFILFGIQTAQSYGMLHRLAHFHPSRKNKESCERQSVPARTLRDTLKNCCSSTFQVTSSGSFISVSRTKMARCFHKVDVCYMLQSNVSSFSRLLLSVSSLCGNIHDHNTNVYKCF